MRFFSSTLLLFSLVVLVFLTVPTTTLAARDRVQIDANNNVVADNGRPLRGETHYVLGAENIGHDICDQAVSRGLMTQQEKNNLPPLSQRYWWPCFRAFGLNAVRVYANRGNINIDRIVDEADEEGFYVMIDDHHDGTPGDNQCCGDYDWSKSQQFWNQNAPRYKDRTHVFYEAKNEPVAWKARSYNAADVQYQIDLYNLIRGHAPDTHISMWSFSHDTLDMVDKINEAPEIDYSNADVGYHVYGSNHGTNGAVELRAEYPILQTEIGAFNSNQYAPRTAAHEALGISWFWLNGYRENIPITWEPDPWAVSGPISPTPTIDPSITLTPTPIPSPTPSPSPIPTPVPIGFPGLVQAEDFDVGGQGIGFHEITPDAVSGGPGSGVYRTDVGTDGPDIQSTGEDYLIGWITAGDWLAYAVDVPETGVYSFDFLVASAESDDKTLSLSVDDSNLASSVGSVTFNTGGAGWQAWQTETIPNITLTAGTHTLYAHALSDRFNFNHFVSTSISAPPTSPGDTNDDGKVDVLDYSTLINQFGSSGDNLSADFNEDGKVDILDYSVLVRNFGK